MAPAPPLDLDKSKDVTRPDFSMSKEGINVRELLISLMRKRYLPCIGPAVRQYMEYELAAQDLGSIRYDGQAILVMLNDYGNMLSGAKSYQKVYDLFFQNLNKTGAEDLEKEELAFKNLLTLCFFPARVDLYAPQDDWIMMILSITVDMVYSVLHVSGNARLAISYLHWAMDVLQPSRDYAFHVSDWLFLRWLDNYKLILDRKRPVTLLYDPTVLNLPKKELAKELSCPLPKERKWEEITRPHNLSMATVLCPHEPRHATYGEREAVNLKLLKPLPPVKKSIITDYMLSFVLHRIESHEDKLRFLEQHNSPEHLNICQQPNGKAIIAICDIISSTELYQKLHKAMLKLYCREARSYQNTVETGICGDMWDILPDNVLTVFLLASDLINFLVKKTHYHGAYQLMQCSCDILDTDDMRSTVQDILFSMSHNSEKIKQQTSFEIIMNGKIIGEDEDRKVAVIKSAKDAKVDGPAEPAEDNIAVPESAIKESSPVSNFSGRTENKVTLITAAGDKPFAVDVSTPGKTGMTLVVRTGLEVNAIDPTSKNNYVLPSLPSQKAIVLSAEGERDEKEMWKTLNLAKADIDNTDQPAKPEPEDLESLDSGISSASQSV